MATEEYSVGYEAGYQDGFNAAQPEQSKGECIHCGGDCPRFECDTFNTWMNEPTKSTTDRSRQYAIDLAEKLAYYGAINDQGLDDTPQKRYMREAAELLIQGANVHGY